MQLPFVLQSAETMKAAVAFLEPFMEKADQGGKGTVVLATVKGDVHEMCIRDRPCTMLRTASSGNWNVQALVSMRTSERTRSGRASAATKDTAPPME